MQQHHGYPKGFERTLTGRIFLVRNRVCKLPATYHWLLYQNEDEWSEEIRADLLQNFPLIEAPLILRMRCDLDVIIGIMALLADEQSSHHAIARESLTKLMEIRGLLDQVYQKIYIYQLSPSPAYIAAQFLERNWGKMVKEVRSVAERGPMPKEKDDPVAHAWMALANNMKIMDNHLAVLLKDE